MYSTARLARASFCGSRARSTTFVLAPCCGIKKRIAPDRDRRIGLGDLVELHADVSLARIRAHGFREHPTPLLRLDATLSSIACMIEGTPAITITLPIPRSQAPPTPC
jgi:hypothetical protein